MIRDAVKWAGALVLAYILVNLILIPYYHYTPGIPLEVNATKEIYYPDSVFLTTGEGYRAGRFDINGYLNEDSRQGYTGGVLVMGSSHTMGKEVPKGYNYCELLNRQYGIPVYNIGMDGHFYPDYVAGFEAALKQFPDPSAIVMETSVTEFDIGELRDALTQREYDEALSGSGILASRTGKERVKSTLQTWLPYRILLRQKLNALKAQTVEKDTGSMEEYGAVLSQTMALMRSMYDKPVIILYHPVISVDGDGNISAVTDNEQTKEAFKHACEENDMIFADMSEPFVEEYRARGMFPHGFMNTSMGTGHLNRTGHALVAGSLAPLLDDNCK